MTKDYGPQPLGNILKQPAKGATGDLFTNLLPHIHLAAKPLKPLSRVRNRLLEPRPEHDPQICFQHSVICQTGLPYRDPGANVRVWERKQGNVSLRIEAGAISDPLTGHFVDLSLPWGTKPRLILAYLNAEALRQGTPEIEIDDSLSAFVRRIRGFDSGREIRMFKDQLTRLSNALIRLAMLRGERMTQINTHVVTGFDLWLPRNEHQRVLWPSAVRLSNEYFESLQQHAVPLNEADLASLAHTAIGLDIYAWLAQRLHRIDPRRPAFIPWLSLKEQFGPDYAHMNHFKAKFRVALRQVITRYQAARIELNGKGMTVRNSPPPVPKRLMLLNPPSSKQTATSAD
jgi:Plasmid encoded RepA protein